MAYTVKVGGVHITEDGKPWAEGAVVGTYYDLSYKHVQALWAVMADPEVTVAYQGFIQAFVTKVGELGNRYALQTGKLSRDDFEALKRVAT